MRQDEGRIGIEVSNNRQQQGVSSQSHNSRAISQGLYQPVDGLFWRHLSFPRSQKKVNLSIAELHHFQSAIGNGIELTVINGRAASDDGAAAIVFVEQILNLPDDCRSRIAVDFI